MRKATLAGLVASLSVTMGLASDYWPARPESGIALRGSEHGGSFVEDTPGWSPHLVTLFITAKNPDAPWHTAAQHIAWVRDPLHSYVADGTGAYVIIAHPGPRQFDQIIGLDLDAMEVNRAGQADIYEELWDRVLTWRISRGMKPVWGTGSDDTHSITQIDLSWIALRVPELNEFTVKRSLREGNFYVSNGPVITDIQSSGGKITVRLAEAADVRWVRDGQFGIASPEVSERAGANRCLQFDRSVKESSFTLGGRKPLFVRCIVTTSTPGKAAQTQPFVIGADGAIKNPYAPAGQWHKGGTHNHVDFQEGSEARIRDYAAAYAAKGHSAAFETAYDYWIMPMSFYPWDRTPVIESVTHDRISAGRGATAELRGRGFAEGAKVLIDRVACRGAKRQSANAISLRIPANLGVGRHDITVRNPDRLQATVQYAITVQRDAAANAGWESYTPLNSKLGSRHVYTLAADPHKGMWVGTNYGINYFEGDKVSLFREEERPGRLDNTVYDLAPAPDGAVWYTCLRGVGVLSKEGVQRRWNWKEAGFPRNQVNQILRAGDDVYVTMHNLPGFFRFRDGAWSRINLPPGAGELNAIVQASDGRFWIGSTRGLLVWDSAKGDQGWTQYNTQNSGLPDNFIRRLAFDRQGGLWIATATQSEGAVGGLCRFTNGAWTVYSPTNSPLPERRVWSVFPDSKGNVWAGTSKGVARLSPTGGWTIYNTVNSGLADPLVTDIAEDTEGNLWFATANGLSRFRPER